VSKVFWQEAASHRSVTSRVRKCIRPLHVAAGKQCTMHSCVGRAYITMAGT